ncbi:MAG: aminotransferase class III-fold pyridoxal phosphate-dependent enzyme, partial [Candidatus Omnitrophica bacterium]|nr:aminotransferase class III-fold pyridoxal phosphate-dependent enzyme [Candidatus Omnitrophota bacterium]
MKNNKKNARLSISKKLFRSAVQYMVGGVNSPVRSFKSVGGNPLFIAKGNGSCLVDVDGNSYVDYVMSWGAIILGHAHESVGMAVRGALKTGTSFGAPTAKEVEFSRMLCRAVPSVELVRLVNSGTEAVMSAIRVSRGYTGKNKIIKFEGCYHGHYDGLLVKAGSGSATFGVPDSAGVPSGLS